MTIHHHIDAASGSLTRLIVDKHDRVLDQVLRRLDDIADGLAKTQKSVKSELKGFNTEYGKVKAMVENLSVNDEAMKELNKNLQVKLDKIEQAIQQNKCSSHPEDSVEVERRVRTTNHKRAESTQSNSLTTSADQPAQRNGDDRGESRICHSKTSTKSHRSYNSGTQAAQAINNDKATKREYLPGMGAMGAPIPDIRHHPAYAGIPQPQQPMVDQNGVPINGIAYPVPTPFDSQSFGEPRWYQQAYGSH